jgi:hypothetical protein
MNEFNLPDGATVDETTGVISWNGNPPDAALQNNVMREMRRRAYPSWNELADATYHAESGNPAPMAAYIAKCDAVKAAYPVTD